MRILGRVGCESGSDPTQRPQREKKKFDGECDKMNLQDRTKMSSHLCGEDAHKWSNGDFKNEFSQWGGKQAPTINYMVMKIHGICIGLKSTIRATNTQGSRLSK